MDTVALIEELKQFNTPTIANVVATYGEDPLCLRIYDPLSHHYYTDQSIHCVFPELGRTAGYAITCLCGPPDPEHSKLSFLDLVEALDGSPKPTVLVLEQRFPPEYAGKMGMSGGNLTSAMKAVGCVGVVTNGPSRDLDEIRPMKVQYMLSGVAVGHLPIAVHGINVPVTVAGMDVAPGEIVHMDENGACKFPAQHLAAVVAASRKLQHEEDVRMTAFLKAKSAAEIRAIFEGHTYARSDEK